MKLASAGSEPAAVPSTTLWMLKAPVSSVIRFVRPIATFSSCATVNVLSGANSGAAHVPPSTFTGCSHLSLSKSQSTMLVTMRGPSARVT